VHRANARAAALFGDLAGARVEELLEGGGPLLSSVLGADPGAPAEERLHSLRARGRAGPFAAEVGAASTPDAVPYAAILSVRDLTERQRMEEALTRSLHEKDTLLREVHHRVKNNLQIVSSLLTMQAQNLGDGPAAGALTEAVHRVRSMAFVHRQLYGTDHLARVDLGAYAQALGQSLVSSLDPAATVAFAVEPVEVAVDTAVPCGLVLNELLTNALKHGRSPDGSCHLRVEVRGDGDGFVLSVGDRGPGFAPRSAAPTSLGMQLIRTLGRQVRGKVEMVNEGGAVVRIRVPFDQPRPPQGPSTAA
jgi:two-component sensor histidine kinase